MGKTATQQKVKLGVLMSVVGFLAFVEFTSGVMQGYYTPMLTDIARHLGIHDADVNWFEGGQLMLAVLIVPVFAKLADIYGPKRMLLLSSALTALASFILPFTDSFWVFLVGWTLQAFYVVWLPLNIAIMWSRTRGQDGATVLTARAAGILVAALEAGAISGALVGGLLVDSLPLWIVLLIPALLVTACTAVIALGIEDVPGHAVGKLDVVGISLISIALIAFTGGLSLLRLNGAGSVLSWLVILAGVALFVPFVLWELRQEEPLIDVRMFKDSSLFPIFLTAGLFGVSVLGAQAPLSTFARTDPNEVGYGLGATGSVTSLFIGLYLIGMIIGALLYPKIARLSTPRLTLIGAAILVGIGYLMFLPFHGSFANVATNMFIAGIGSGALVAALPSAAAAAARRNRTAMATGMTNTTKTLGGAIASAVFALALMQGVSDSTSTAGSLSGYMTVWAICGLTAWVAALALVFVPKDAFTDKSALLLEEGVPLH